VTTFSAGQPTCSGTAGHSAAHAHHLIDRLDVDQVGVARDSSNRADARSGANSPLVPAVPDRVRPAPFTDHDVRPLGHGGAGSASACRARPAIHPDLQSGRSLRYSRMGPKNFRSWRPRRRGSRPGAAEPAAAGVGSGRAGRGAEGPVQVSAQRAAAPSSVNDCAAAAVGRPRAAPPLGHCRRRGHVSPLRSGRGRTEDNPRQEVPRASGFG